MKYKHKTTGEEATLLEDYYQVGGDVVPKRFIESSSDWRKAYFTSTDNIDIFIGDTYYVAQVDRKDNLRGEYIEFILSEFSDKSGDIFFAKKENAEKYIAENSKRFSLEDIREALKATLPCGLGGYPKWEEDFTKDFEEYLLP